MIKEFLVEKFMKNSSFDDHHSISSSQFWQEEDEKTMITPVSYCQEQENESEEGEDRSVLTRRSRRGEKSEEGLWKTMMITRPRGGKGYLCMDSEEMKACKDLGFELEEDKLKFEFRLHGDDPRDVKARLKLWAQAVAQASSHRRARG